MGELLRETTMFLFCLFNPYLKNCTQYWCNWKKNEFIRETKKAIEYLTPYFTESDKERLWKRTIYATGGLKPDLIKEIEPGTLVRWPMQLIVYANDRTWEWAFEPPHCPLRPLNSDLTPEEQEEVVNKYDFFTPKRIHYGTSLEKAIQDWSISDEIWLDYAFKLMKKAIPEILENPTIGKCILNWCEENEYNAPVFANKTFYAYNKRLKKVLSLQENEEFAYIQQLIGKNSEIGNNDCSYTIHCHQQPEHSPLVKN